MSTISEEEKNIFLEDLESEEEEENFETKKKEESSEKKSYGTAIFASIFVFFILIVVLLIFLLSIADTGNPVFVAFGIEGYEIKSFLLKLSNKIFMTILIVLLLSAAVGIFRGYSFPKEQKKKRRGSFVFGAVSAGLIFFSILAWGSAVAFIENFVTGEYNHGRIQMLNIPDGEIVAPIDITFSAEDIKKELTYQNKIVRGFRWSKNEGKTFSVSSLNPNYTFQFLNDGVQIITLEVELLSGEIKEYTQIFLVDKATFLMKPSKILQGKSFSLDSSNLFNGSAKYLWDFDNDGIYEKETRSSLVKLSYDTKGEKTIHLRIESDNDEVKMYSKTFIVYGDTDKLLDAIINTEETTGKSPFKVTLSAGNSYSTGDKIIKYTWEIEGKTQQGEILDYTFKNEGVYTVVLTIETESGKIDTEEIEIVVTKGNSPPNATLYTKPTIDNGSKKILGYLPLTVNFYGGKSTDAEENIMQHKWTLINEEGDKEEMFGEKQEYVFRKQGIYTMILRVSDTEGEYSEESVEIEVQQEPVIPIISVFPESGTAPLIVEFNASLSTCRTKDCKIISYEWDYDDKTKIINGGAFTSHQFIEPGSYNVSVTAITNNGDRVEKIVYVTVTEKPLVACFSSSRTEGIAPVMVAFDPTTCSKGNIVKYQWDFGDGYVSKKEKTVHSYASPGTYTAILQVFDKSGRVNTMKEVITVKSRAD